MSIFKTKGIVLKIHKNSEKNFLYTIFTHDYGKIICSKKFSAKEKTLDIGYLINFEIETKQESSIHKIRNVKILFQLEIHDKNFSFINYYLECIAVLNKNSTMGLPNNTIIPLFENYYSLENPQEEKMLLIKILLYKTFGLLPENHEDKIVEKILKFIHKYSPSVVLKLGEIPEIQKKKLEDLMGSL